MMQSTTVTFQGTQKELQYLRKTAFKGVKVNLQTKEGKQ